MKERDGECGGREKDFFMRHNGFISYILDTAWLRAVFISSS